MKYIVQLVLIMLGIAVFSILQFQYWFGENGRSGTAELTKQIAEQQILLDKQIEINRIITEDVKDLKTGLEAIEEHARLDLGYIKPGETFVQMSMSTDSKPTVDSTGEQKYVEAIPDPYVPVN